MQISSLNLLFQLVLCTFSCLLTTSAIAQVTPDDTLDTQVDSDGKVVEITGGQTRGDNLFHSFQDFSVQTGKEAFFNNASGISNIFSRVTGDNVSTIDGLIRANGSASLFLINPNGIIFSEGAQLDIGGSFLGSTASSILFDEGEFSAVNLDSPPLLTIDAPIGLGLPDNPAAIVNRSTVQDSEGKPVGLEILEGNNLSLVGGNIRFEEGDATARGGKVELGGLSAAGTVGISEDGSLNFPEGVVKADISLSDGAVVDASSAGGGNIILNARSLNLTESSVLKAGIAADSTLSNAQAGDIEIDLTNNLNLDNSNITNTVEAGGVGNSGDVNIATDSIKATNKGQIDTNTFSQGNGGNVNIVATGDITFDGENNNLESGVISLVISGAVGNAGNITISTGGKLALTNGGRVDVSSSGQGNAGNITIDAIGDITFDGEDSQLLGSGATSLINPEGVGNAGNITISTGGNLTLTNGGRISVSSSGQGNAGNITIDAIGDITFDGEDSELLGSGATSLVNLEGVGNAGNITISTGGNLTLTNRGRVEANNNGSGQGNGGNVTIDVGGNFTVDGEKNYKGFGSNVRSLVNNNATGDSGNITVSTGGNLTVKNKGEVDASSSGKGDSGNITVSTGGNLTLSSGGKIDTNINTQGNGGDIIINAVGDITFEGDDSNGDGSGATSLVGEDGSGNAGNITISTQGKLSLTDGGRVDASSNKGQGNAGLVEIATTGDIFFEGQDSRGFGSGATSQANPGVEAGNSGGVTIFTGGNLTLKNGGRVDTSTNAPGDAGSVDITANGDITFEGKATNGEGSGVTSQVNPEAEGNAGIVTIFTQGNLALKDGGRIDVSINTQKDTENTARTNADINLQVAENLTLDNDSLISARASGNADGGNLDIDSGFIITFPDGNNDIIASAEQGQGGNITIDAKSLFSIEERPLSDSTNDINASSEFNSSGTVEIDVLEVDPSQDSLNIPVAPVETEVAQACEVDRDRNQSEFVVTGRGGLPDSPEANLNSNFVLEDWRVEADNSATSFRTPEKSLAASRDRTESIVEANSWIVNDRGEIVLVANNNAPNKLAPQSADCQTN